MSREDIPNALIRLTNITGYDHTQEANLTFKQATEEIERLLADEREKVRDSFINATCILCRTEKPYLMWFGGKNWKGRYQAWVHDVKLEGHIEVQTCPADAIRQLDLTKDLAASRDEGKG